MNKKRLFSILFQVSLIGLLFYLILGSDEKKETVNLNKTKEDVLKGINESKQYVKKTTEWMGDTSGEGEISYFNPPQKKGSNSDPKKDVVKFFLGGLLTNDVEIFMSSFYAQTISEDLFKKKNVTDKTVVVQEIMNRISRNGQLKGVQYQDKKGAFNAETDKLSLILIYKDNKQATITLQLMPVKDEHGEHKKEILVITTHAWDVIKQIETQTK
jgi:hypothetical protein